MSIINQMLHKLEQRRGGRDSGLPDGVRAVAAPASGRKSVILALVLLILASSGGAWWWLKWQQRHQAQGPAKAVSAGKVPVPPVSVPDEKEGATPDEVKQLAEIAKRVLDESSRSAEKSAKVTKKADSNVASGKKDDAAKDNEQLIRKTESEAPQAETPPVVRKSLRESSGKIRATDGSMKSVTPEQQALHHYQKALSLLQQGRVAEARSELEESLRIDQFLLSARQALAALLVEQKQYTAAEVILQEGVNINPEQYGFAMALARLQVERGDSKAAIETMNRSLPFAHENAGYQAFLAVLYQRAEQHRKAIDFFQSALRLSRSGPWLVGLASSLQAEGRNAEALDTFILAKSLGDLSPELIAFAEQKIRQIKVTMGR